ncbi:MULTISPECIES: hypothetical protein [Pseudoalteromonas]|uniref:Orphan protein n=2 Tax=Pseudoalteromonas TaxID=53246 RepID=A0ABU1BJQ0_PSEHA|nr:MULTISPECIES: hypothetical protein [Pseudoalteromonas]MCF6145956.1 hypothetical protein [Pseudoalteromonas mariniglutinosa NCIMB 1770]MDQ9094006.1 hypothetical protein [Pseudoalteromonas haloplanktis]BDF95603.1 hypothetical protein KAN5_24410 [Pseudoalteromonas sp. KAN5]
MISGCDNNVTVQQHEHATKPSPVSALEQYPQQASDLLNSIRAKKDAASLEAESAQLVILSLALIKEVIVKYPQCTEYLNALSTVATAIASLPLIEIENGYHSDGKLPPFDDPVCYHAKDLVVHPATVQAHARLGLDDQLAYQNAELDVIEVLAHFEQLEQALAD